MKVSQATLEKLLEPGWEDAALEIVDGLPCWVKKKNGHLVAKRVLADGECEVVRRYFRARIRDAERRQGKRRGFAA
jgi:hypothetical protein